MPAPPELFDPNAFLRALAYEGPVMGLDPGTKTIGVALSDWDRSMASPIRTIQRTSFARDAETLLSLIAKEHVVGLVIGLPLNADGTSGPRAQSVRAFRRSLSEYIALPMLFWDERYSSATARDQLRDVHGKADKMGGKVDAAAAAIILGDALKALVSERSKTNQ